MKLRNIFYIMFSLTLVFTSCKEEVKRISENSTTPPGVVSDIVVTNLPGSAEIKYRLPMDKDLLYVKAVYTLASGKQMEVKSSYYNNYLLVDGFAEEMPYQVQLYAVNRSEVASEPVEVTVNPLENPIWVTYRSLQASASFGGIQIKAENEAERDLTIMVMKDSLGEWVPSVDNIYTSAKEIMRNVRGLDTIPQTFAITVRDRFLNFTDTLVTTLTPLFEMPLAKSRYATVVLPTDIGMAYESTTIDNLWDGDTFWWPNVVVTLPNAGQPQWITFDAGQLAQMSRIVVWNYPEYTNDGRAYFYGGNLRDFEIWGSANPPANGSWDNWYLLGKFVDVKPSGLPYGQTSSEDYNLATNGLSYDFDVAVPRVRYIRIKSNRNWIGSSFMAVAEVLLYGDPR